jgi:hypothetical protein
MKVIQSFVIGTITGAIAGSFVDRCVISISPMHYAMRVPSGVVSGMFLGGIGGVLSECISNDSGILGGTLVGVTGGVLGGITAPK